MLPARVAAGELPPVEERIPFDPVVQEMLSDGVGRYGGTLRVSEAIGFMNQRGGELTTQMLDIYLLTMHQETLDIVPNIAAGYAVSDDGLTVTLELRPGTRWSNGDPFIVDDLMFVMEDMKWDDRVDPGWRAAETPTFPYGSNLTIQIAARTGGPVDISKLFELEIAQWAEVDLRVAPRLVDDAAWGDNQDADELMLQPGGIDAITEFWNWINDGAGSGGVGLHGDFNMTGSYDEWETARRLVERGERKLSDYGGELPGIEAARGVETLLRLAAPVPPLRVRLGGMVRAGPEDVRLHRRQRVRDRHRRRGPQTSCSPTTTCATCPPSSRSPTPTGKATSCTGPSNSGSTGDGPHYCHVGPVRRNARE